MTSARRVCKVILSLFLLCPALLGVLVFPPPLSGPFKAAGYLRMPFDECRQTLVRLPSQALSPWSCRAAVSALCRGELDKTCPVWISRICWGRPPVWGFTRASSLPRTRSWGADRENGSEQNISWWLTCPYLFLSFPKCHFLESQLLWVVRGSVEGMTGRGRTPSV